MNKVSFVVGADIVPTIKSFPRFKTGNVYSLLSKDLVEILNNVDFRIFNLETPLTDHTSPIEKCGPSLSAPTCSVAGIKALNPDLLTLANNHIMDHGERGLKSTLYELQKENIPYVGVGESLSLMNKSFILRKNKIKIAFYACVEHEFSVASNRSAGANPLDLLTIFDEVENLKRQNDLVVVLYHGAKEHYQYPTPNISDLFHKLAMVGADIVIAQHTHCVGCFENFGRSVLVYGQGNFHFDKYENRTLWNSSLLLKVTLDEKTFNVDFIPLELKNGLVCLSPEGSNSKIIRDFECRSSEILEDGFAEKKYSELSKEMIGYYLRLLKGNPFYLKVLSKLFGNKFVLKFYSKKNLLAVQNIFECEAHRELVIKGLQECHK